MLGGPNLLGGPGASSGPGLGPFFADLWAGGSLRVGPCTATAGLVALGPGRRGGLEVLVTGTDNASVSAARRAFESRLFDTNSWQHRGGDFVLLRTPGRLADVLAAGSWGPAWEFRADFAYTDC